MRMLLFFIFVFLVKKHFKGCVLFFSPQTQLSIISPPKKPAILEPAKQRDNSLEIQPEKVAKPGTVTLPTLKEKPLVQEPIKQGGQETPQWEFCPSNPLGNPISHNIKWHSISPTLVSTPLTKALSKSTPPSSRFSGRVPTSSRRRNHSTNPPQQFVNPIPAKAQTTTKIPATPTDDQVLSERIIDLGFLSQFMDMAFDAIKASPQKNPTTHESDQQNFDLSQKPFQQGNDLLTPTEELTLSGQENFPPMDINAPSPCFIQDRELQDSSLFPDQQPHSSTYPPFSALGVHSPSPSKPNHISNNYV